MACRVTHRLRAIASFPKDMNSNPITLVAHNRFELQFQGFCNPLLASEGTKHTYGAQTYM